VSHGIGWCVGQWHAGARPIAPEYCNRRRFVGRIVDLIDDEMPGSIRTGWLAQQRFWSDVNDLQGDGRPQYRFLPIAVVDRVRN
jgi:hypothetical protein